MKKILFFLSISIAFSGMLLNSCGGGNKLTSEEEVRNYGKYFVEKLSANQLDSLKYTYPDLTVAESLVPVSSDTIVVVETNPGQYDVTLAKGITLKVRRSEDGKISVIESKGLFSFPSDKVKIAKKTGMWDDKLSDGQLNERMKDKEFFKYIKNKKNLNSKHIIKIGDFYDDYPEDEIRGSGVYEGYQKLTNTTGTEIKGSDYSIVYYCLSWYGEDEEKWTEVKPGKTIPAHGSVRVDASSGYHGGCTVEKIKWKLSDAQLQEKFAPYTGKEYQEYLNSKK